MRTFVQRVSSASVSIDSQVISAIGSGLLILLGVAAGDTTEDAAWLTQKTPPCGHSRITKAK
jgi:D-tyrosyl-tRNA(Tyr) deacylase